MLGKKVIKRKVSVKPVTVGKVQRKKILGFFDKGETKTPLEKAQESYKQFIYVTVNGAKFTVAPNSAVNSIKAYAKTHVGMRYMYNNWLKLNNKYQLLLGDSYSKDDVCKGAGMKVWDVAVPQPWLDQPENLKKWKSGEWAVWSYDGANRTFGGPVWRTEVFSNLKKNVLAALR